MRTDCAWEIRVPILDIPQLVRESGEPSVGMAEQLTYLGRLARAAILGVEVKWILVRLKEKEFTQLLHVCRNARATKAKEAVQGGQEETRAFLLWPSGSTEDIGMRILGPWAVRMLVNMRSLQEWSSPLCCGYLQNKTRTELRRWSAASGTFMKVGTEAPGKPSPCKKDTGGVAETTSAATVWEWCLCEHPDKDRVPSAETSTGVRVCTTCLCTMRPPTTGAAPASAVEGEIAIADHSRVLRFSAGTLVIGQDASDAPRELVGSLIAPSACPPLVYSNTAGNLTVAKVERIDKKQRPYVCDQQAKQRRGSIVARAMGNTSDAIWSRSRIEKWITCNNDVKSLVSKKWSDVRTDASVLSLYNKAFPTFEFKGAVKAERMPEGKAPRMLIADGDDGQLMALTVIKCFEDLLFEKQESRSMKHASRPDGVARVLKTLNLPGSKLIEGDGSSWDTTCSDGIRSELENPVIARITCVMIEAAVCPPVWHAEHREACERKELKIFFKRKLERCKLTINAIRRSGHRGTSCLNWWINFCMWTSSVFREPARFLDPTRRKGTDLTGTDRKWVGAFEGDDSLCALTPPMEKGDHLSKMFEDTWEKAGFNMKLVYVTERATFCGMHIKATAGKVGTKWCPEIPRAFCSEAYSSSRLLMDAIYTGDGDKAKCLAAGAMLARAHGFAGRVPTISRKYTEYARSLGKAELTHDTRMRISGTADGPKPEDIFDEIERENGKISPDEEKKFCADLGFPATEEELLKFSTYLWDWTTLTQFGDFESSLPLTWRS